MSTAVAPDRLPPRELDALVAEKVMGFRVIETDDCNGEDNYWLSADGVRPACWPTGIDRQLPNYSTEMDAALQVHDLFDTYEMVRRFAPPDDFWGDRARYTPAASDFHDTVSVCRFKPEAFGESPRCDALPRAICLAALKAVNP